MKISNVPKYIFLGFILAMFLCFVMGGVTLRREILSRIQKPHTDKPSPPLRPTFRPPTGLAQKGPVQPAQTPILNPPPPVLRSGYVLSPGLPTPGPLLGKFEGKTLLENRGIVCGVSMELHGDADHAAKIVGYESLQCMDPMAMYSTPKTRSTVREMVMGAAARTLPVNYILAGERQPGGVVQLKILKAVGNHDKCVMTTGTLSPFGSRQVLFEWEDGTCGRGEMLLTQIGT